MLAPIASAFLPEFTETCTTTISPGGSSVTALPYLVLHATVTYHYMHVHEESLTKVSLVYPPCKCASTESAGKDSKVQADNRDESA